MGLGAVCPKRRTRVRGRETGVHPYLLAGLAIERPNQVWAITYIRLRRGFAYPVAVTDRWAWMAGAGCSTPSGSNGWGGR